MLSKFNKLKVFKNYCNYTTINIPQLSNIGIKITNCFLSKKVTDPLSGFFMITNQKFGDLQEKLYKDGFKILFDLLMLNKQLRVKEVGIDFRSRIAGQSKLNISTAFNLVGQI